jgi:hypothetical protein|tara:strand:- start:1738 stop:1950 length:213 start_codon:yes stop_codon:yes gene_type:complete
MKTTLAIKGKQVGHFEVSPSSYSYQEYGPGDSHKIIITSVESYDKLGKWIETSSVKKVAPYFRYYDVKFH